MVFGLGFFLNIWCWGFLLILLVKFIIFFIRVWMVRIWVFINISGLVVLNLLIMFCCNFVFLLRFFNRLIIFFLLWGVWLFLFLLFNLVMVGRRWLNEDNRLFINCLLKIVVWNCFIKGILFFIVMVSFEIVMLGYDNYL